MGNSRTISQSMHGAPDSRASRVGQTEFDRLTTASRDDWRKWERRRLVRPKPKGLGYTWSEIVQAIALKALENGAGMAGVVACWDDVREQILTTIRQTTLDLVIDPGVSSTSRPNMRAFISTNDADTARLARAAEHPIVITLAERLDRARTEFERVIARTAAHADRPPSEVKSDKPRSEGERL